MASNDFVFFPTALPLLGAALALCSKAFFRGIAAKGLEYFGAFLGLFLPWAILVLLLPGTLRGEVITGTLGEWTAVIGVTYRFDGLSWLLLAMTLSTVAPSWVYSLGAGPQGPVFTAVFLVMVSAVNAAAVTADLFNLFVCLEVFGVASYVLMVLSEKPGAYLASFSYLMVSAAAMVFYLLGVYGLYRLTGTLSYDGVGRALANIPGGGGTAAAFSLTCIAAAALIRTAVMPLGGWLPDAYAAAPHAVSSVLSGVLVKTPLFALGRILLALPGGGNLGSIIGYAGALTALTAVFLALCQADCKKLLAYHSMSQIGYIAAAWGAGIRCLSDGDQSAGNALLAAAFLHSLFHAHFKSLLFLAVGTTADATGERNVYAMRNAGAALKRAGDPFRITTLSFTIGAAAIIGLPPLNGFAGKEFLSFVLEGRWEYFLLFAAGVGTTASFIKLSRIFWPGAKTDGTDHRVKPQILAAEIILAALCVAGGIFAADLSGFVGTLIAGRPAEPLPSSFLLPETALKTGLTLAGGFLLFLAASGTSGRQLTAFVRRRPRHFSGLFFSFTMSLAALSFAAVLMRR